MPLKNFINTKDYEGIEKTLREYPGLANEGIAYNEANPVKAHPLHRICDGVMSKAYTDEEAVKMVL